MISIYYCLYQVFAKVSGRATLQKKCPASKPSNMVSSISAEVPNMNGDHVPNRKHGLSTSLFVCLDTL